MNLSFTRMTAVRCRHCESPDVRVSTRSSGSTDHVTYRCNACKRHFRIHHRQEHRQAIALAAGLLLLLSASTLVAYFLASEDPVAEIPRTVIHDDQSLARLQERARQGNAQAQYDLGRNHWLRGEFLVALPWLQSAARQGHTEATYLLGLASLDGNGTVQNYRLALEHFDQAARKGHLDAQYRLGLLHRDGLAGQSDKEAAYIWLNIAAARGHPEALGIRDKLTVTMSSDTIIRAQETSGRMLAAMAVSPPPAR